MSSGPGERSVFSRTLRAVSWPQATISDDLTGTVGRLKAGETGQEPAFARLPDIGLDLVGQSLLDGRIVLSEYRPSGVPPYAT